MATDKEYLKKYYKENREEMLRKRKERYENDPKYRAKVQAATRRSKQRRRVGLKKRTLGQIDRRHRRPRITVINGQRVEVFSRGTLAEYVGFAPTTLGSWQQRGVLPTPTMVDEEGKWWFSEEYMAKFLKIVKKFRTAGWSLDEFAAIVVENWS